MFRDADFSAVDGTRYCGEEGLDREVRRLHRLALQGCPGIQPHIDAYLPAAALCKEGRVGLARRVVLGLPDAPQVGALPDLGREIRLMLLSGGGACGACSLACLQSALPCIARRPSSEPQEHPQVAICVLLGLLLGLYPKAVRFPPFHVRVALYKRVHLLITAGDAGFCARHPMLMALAFMEYCSFVVPAYLPAEEEVLLGEPGMAGFFSGCGLVCDAFRQDVLATGEEAWQAMEEYCTPHVERHLRTCRNKGGKGRQGEGKVAGAQFCLEAPYVLPYDSHLSDPSHRIMGAEMAFLGFQGAHTAAVQRMISVRPLPENLGAMQLRAVARRAEACERSALSMATLYVCVACVMSGQSGLVQGDRKKEPRARGECRLDVESGRMLCSSCQGDCVLSVSTLGRVVTLRQNKYYLAPCCGAVRLYAGTGDEFSEKANEACRHRQAKGPARSAKHRCELCSNLALVEGISRVDHLTGEFRTVRLCQRHTPHEDSLGQAANWRQLEAEVRRRDRPLFRSER